MENISSRSALVRAFQTRVELKLEDADGNVWSFTASKGMEVFVGRYVRIPEFAPTHQMLTYELVSAA